MLANPRRVQPEMDPEAPKRRARRRRRRRRDLVELSLFSYVASQCNERDHVLDELCPRRNCHFVNLECLERLLRSAKKSIYLSMYQFSERRLCEAIKWAKEKNNVDVQIIVDYKMSRNRGSVCNEMLKSECTSNNRSNHVFLAISLFARFSGLYSLPHPPSAPCGAMRISATPQ